MFHYNLTRITATLHEDLLVYMKTCLFTFMTSRSFLLRMRNNADKSCREHQNTHFVFSNFFPPENPTVYEIMWKNIV